MASGGWNADGTWWYGYDGYGSSGRWTETSASGSQRGAGRGSHTGRGTGKGQAKKKANAAPAPPPAPREPPSAPREEGNAESEMTSRQRREQNRAPLLQENAELKAMLRMEEKQGRDLREEAQTLRSEYVEAVSEESAVKTVLKLQQGCTEAAQSMMGQLRTELNELREAEEREQREFAEHEASSRIYQLYVSKLDT